MSDPMRSDGPKVERGGNLTILTFTAHAIRDVDSVIARELEILAEGVGSGHLLLDFSHVVALNSMELGTLVALHKRVESAGGRLTLFNLKSNVFRLFAITRLDTFLEICRSTEILMTTHSPPATKAPTAPAT